MELNSLLPLIVAGTFGTGLMLAGAVVLRRRTHSRRAVNTSDPENVRDVINLGLVLVAACSLILFVPSIVSWTVFFSSYTGWEQGTLFSFALGFGLGVLCLRVILSGWGRQAGRPVMEAASRFC